MHIATTRAVWRQEWSKGRKSTDCAVTPPRRAENTKSIGNDATARERREEVDGAISTRAEERKVHNWQRLVSVLFGQVLKTPLNLEAAERCGTHSDQRQRR